jgi:ATP-dependent helicase/nuclease subunit A
VTTGDESARQRILDDLASTLFVEAGAGTGKTSALVGRILALVTGGRARLSEIAAITFTEAAAAELADRVAESLERLAAGETSASGPVGEPLTSVAERRRRARAALDELDTAAIGTLHGFARRLLAEHPFEAGLPPGFEVLDEVRSVIGFDERWRRFFDQLLEDPADRPVLLRALVCGLQPAHLEEVARQLGDHWDLVADHVAASGGGTEPPLSRVVVGPVLAALEEALVLADACTDPEDRLLAHLHRVAPVAAVLREAGGGDELVVLQSLADAPPLSADRKGRRSSWGGRVEDVRQLLASAEKARRELLASVGGQAVERLVRRLCHLTLAAADERRRDGRLEFHDLLVHARHLLRTDDAVRRALGAQYRYVLIDEFQDTDPIQAELAVRLTDGEEGRLFFVGDPTQSIYRFRRADIGLFLGTRDLHADGLVRLTRNHRSVPGVLDWVNDLFARLIGQGVPGSQPAFVALDPHRSAAIPTSGETGARSGGWQDGWPPVVLLGGALEATGGIEALRRQAAAELAAAVVRVRDEGWPLGDEGRPARLADITILVPTRTGVPVLQQALEEAGVAYRLETSSLVYGSVEVQELLTVLRAVDDPADPVATVAALRTTIFGCGDDDLVAYHQAGGSWDYRRQPPEVLGPVHPVARAMASLADLHGRRWWGEVSTLVGQVLEERRVLELALDGPRPREAWRRLRFVADQARQFDEGGGGGLRRYLAWAEAQSDEAARVAEVVLPETDDDAVRITTIHAAKGLEFPVVVLAGLETERRSGRFPRVLWDGDRPEVAVSGTLRTAGFDLLEERDHAMEEHERLRLLYVAATRARDHLLVCLHHRAGSRCDAAVVAAACEEMPGRWRRLPPATPSRPPDDRKSLEERPAGVAAANDPDRTAWLARRRALLDRAAFPRTVAATSVAKLASRRGPLDRLVVEAEEAETEEADQLGSPPVWRRGRAGTAVGRAVHATLQQVDLATGEGLEALARASAAAEGVSARHAEVAQLVRAALGSSLVQRAVALRHWRELYVGAPVGDRVLEGFVDLLFEDEEGLSVVDYKTDRMPESSALEAAVARYRLQGAAYAVALEASLSRPVHSCNFLFLGSGGAVARPIEDLEAAKAEVRDLLGASGAG